MRRRVEQEVSQKMSWLDKLKAEDKPLEEPWIDPVSAASGGFGGSLMSNLGKMAITKALTRAAVSGATGAAADYPIGLATEGIGQRYPQAALPFNILAGMGSGMTLEKMAENAIMDPQSLRKTIGSLANETGSINLKGGDDMATIKAGPGDITTPKTPESPKGGKRAYELLEKEYIDQNTDSIRKSDLYNKYWDEPHIRELPETYRKEVYSAFWRGENIPEKIKSQFPGMLDPSRWRDLKQDEFRKIVRERAFNSDGRWSPGDTGIFFRAGDLPSGGRSYNSSEGIYENGVSVYPEPEPTSFAGLGEREWIYGKGKVIDIGSDGEPIIKPIGEWKNLKIGKKDRIESYHMRIKKGEIPPNPSRQAGEPGKGK